MQQTCDPLTARWWFKVRTPVNWVVTVSVFIVLVLNLQTAVSFLLSDVIAVACAFILFFFILDKRTIAITCPLCGKHIEGNSPWVCGVCKTQNLDTDNFSFLGRCGNEKCGAEPKAYKCHHCGELIFFTKDRQVLNFATCVNQPVTMKPVEKEMIVDPIEKRKEDKAALEHELEMARLKAALKDAQSKIETVKVPTIRERLTNKVMSGFEIENEVALLKAKFAEQFKDDPDELARRYAKLDADAASLLASIRK